MLKVALRSIRDHKARFFLTSSAIVLGASFVVASFATADGLRSVFGDLSEDIYVNTDLIVRGDLAFGNENDGASQGVPESLVETVATVDGVDIAEPVYFAFNPPTTPVTDEGEAVTAGFAPVAGINWTDDRLNNLYLLDGALPVGPEQFALSKETIDDEGFVLGERYTVVTPEGNKDLLLVGSVQFGFPENAAVGAILTVFDTDTAQQFLGYASTDEHQEVWASVAEGADIEAVRAAVAAILPPGTEVLTAAEVVQEFDEQTDEFIGVFETVLLVFAFIITFVAALTINNTFNIIVGQRVRELGLLRALGASGNQVRQAVVIEALLVGVVSTIVAFGLGLVIAKGLFAIFASIGGKAFEKAPLGLSTRSIVLATIVGVGITMISALTPARKAAKVPPIAALREGVRLDPRPGARGGLGGVVSGLGALATIVGMVGSFDSAADQLILLGAGALFVFIGVAILSPLIARPLANLIGRPVEAVYGRIGGLARSNAARAPRRTAATAVALTVGLALVTATAIVGFSLKETFKGQLENSLNAELIVLPAGGLASGVGFSPVVTDRVTELTELSAVSPFGLQPALIDGGEKPLSAFDLLDTDELMEVDLISGEFRDDLDLIYLQDDSAEDRGVEVGDTLDVTFRSGEVVTMEVGGIYAQNPFFTNYLVDTTTLRAHTERTSDFGALARVADGVSTIQAEAAVNALLDDFPDVEVQNQADFLANQLAQLDITLAIIYGLIGFAGFVAIIGIANTLTLSVFERTREIGLMRAVGMSRRQLRRMIRWEAVIIAFFGALVGLTLGLIFGISLTVAIPDNFIDQIAIPFPTLLGFLVTVFLAALMAAFLPAWRASKMNVLDAISHE